MVHTIIHFHHYLIGNVMNIMFSYVGYGAGPERISLTFLIKNGSMHNPNLDSVQI